jgi:hypothetical protein
MLLLAREIPGATFKGVFRAFFVPEPTLTSWRFANLTGLCEGDFGYGSRGLAIFFASHE